MRQNVRGDGRCLENCTAIHTKGDEKEGIEIRKMINTHVADNWEGYWKNKIGLPYKDTVLVDGKQEAIENKTDEEMIEFLRSENAQKVFSKGHQLIAIANLFNINISLLLVGRMMDGM